MWTLITLGIIGGCFYFIPGLGKKICTFFVFTVILGFCLVYPWLLIPLFILSVILIICGNKD